jgi:hypothetical protein
MDDFDWRLQQRLERLEGSLPMPTSVRRPVGVGRRLSVTVASGIAIVALLTGGIAGAVGAVIVSNAATGHPSVFGSGEPLECTRIQAMTPPNAGELLTELGYSVTWQIEDRDRGTYEQTPIAPPDGYIIDGVLVRGNLILVVERGENAVPVSPSC